MPETNYDLSRVSTAIAGGMYAMLSQEGHAFDFNDMEVLAFRDSLRKPPQSMTELKAALNTTRLGRELKDTVCQNIEQRQFSAPPGHALATVFLGITTLVSGTMLGAYMYSGINGPNTPEGRTKQVEDKKVRESAKAADRMAAKYYNPTAVRPLAKARVLEALKKSKNPDGTPWLEPEDMKQIDGLIEVARKKEALDSEQAAILLHIYLLMGITALAGGLTVACAFGGTKSEADACREGAEFFKGMVSDRLTGQSVSARLAGGAGK